MVCKKIQSKLDDLATKLQNICTTRGLPHPSEYPDRATDVLRKRRLLHTWKKAAPGSFDSPQQFQLVYKFCEVLCVALRIHEREIAREVLDCTLHISSPARREIVLNTALEVAAEENDLETARWILQHESNDQLAFLERPLVAAAVRKNEAMVGCLMQRLLRDHEEDASVYAKVMGVVTAQGYPIDHATMYRASVVVRALETCIARGLHSIAPMLMAPYHAVVASTGRNSVTKAFRHTATRQYSSFERIHCLRLLYDQQMPAVLRESIRNALENGKETDLEVEAGSTVYAVHRDVLMFWSGFYRKVLDHAGSTHDLEVEVPVKMDEGLARVLEFMYTGEYEERHTDGGESHLARMLSISEALDIPNLSSTVSDLLGASLDLG
ncbi:hypothetical protein BDW62DRAFT_200161 [Aspergillus aurantiobrunneus]